jgi:predicted permease
MPWVMFLLGALFFAVLGRLAGWSRQTTGGLMLSGGLANTSFVGLPMIEAFYGPGFLGIGVLADQLGSYLVLSTLGVLVAALYSAAGPVRLWTLARRIAGFPPFQALVLSTALAPFGYPDALSAVLDRLAATLTPLALVSVGYQLRLGGIGDSLRELSAGLLYKLLLGPALVALLFVLGLRAGGMVLQVTVFEAAMGPMIGGAIVAMDHGLNPPLVTLMVGLGIPLSLMTAAAWSQLLGGL